MPFGGITLLSKFDVFEKKFFDWRDDLPPHARKAIKIMINAVIIALIIGAVLITYNAGKQAGKIEMCEQDGLILVEFRGLYECWSQDVYDNYISQFETRLQVENGLQYNYTG